MKIASIIRALEEHDRLHPGSRLNRLLVHTGQHYDEQMSALFFRNLDIPAPDVNLEVHSASQARQTAEIMVRFEGVCQDFQPTHVLVVGDVNSTIACALVAAKLGIKVIHVEAGLRSRDRSMPEEINRILTDAISDLLFTSEEDAGRNLLREGIPEERIHFVGNVMIDTLLHHRRKAEGSDILSRLGLAPAPAADGMPVPYGVLTLHRPSNVDNADTFAGIIEAVREISGLMPIVFPVHPRTAQRIRAYGLEGQLRLEETVTPAPLPPERRILCIPPLGYLDFLHLLAHARIVLTDSGGIQEETTILGVPCVTLRENTERPVTVTMGTNRVSGVRREGIIEASRAQLSAAPPAGASRHPPFWDGKAAERIVEILAAEQASPMTRPRDRAAAG